ncbi:MAG: dimethyl sulfoxide reductase anchor subunit [Anaerolineales bacterium]|jgi:anaerobic dimethyl sulfoxide reductase subunit C (anchor subunit)
MNPREWALIIFTLLAQMAAGGFIVLQITRALLVGRLKDETSRLTDLLGVAIMGILAVGMLASLIHLGSPLRAYRAVSNFGSSWLSREITFASGFFVFGSIYSLMQWGRWASSGLRNVLATLSGLLALGMIYSMSRIYMIPTEPAWDSFETLISFFTAAFLLGIFLTGSGLVIRHRVLQQGVHGEGSERGRLLSQTLGVYGILAVVLVGVEFVALPVYMAEIGDAAAAAGSSLQELLTSYGLILLLRLLLVFIGAGVLGALIYRFAEKRVWQTRLATLTIAGFSIVLVSEVLSRFLFYATRVRMGLP